MTPPNDVHPRTVERYLANYGLESASVGPEEVSFHWNLELRLTRELLDSTPENRWDTFERCYTELYEQLPWLADTGGDPDPARWARLIGPPPRAILEVGSGAGALASRLAALRYQVVATDVSRKRGGEREATPNLTWEVTDGVHLGEHTTVRSFDAVISDQVLEHLHPSDISLHLKGALDVLKPGGRYAFRTPHAATGPHDISAVFGQSRAVGMHLREYTCAELARQAKSAGFVDVQSVVYLPRVPQVTFSSTRHLRYQLWLERSTLARRPRGRAALRVLPPPFRPSVWLVASKPT